jgi:hypothetical protein
VAAISPDTILLLKTAEETVQLWHQSGPSHPEQSPKHRDAAPPQAVRTAGRHAFQRHRVKVRTSSRKPSGLFAF